MIDIYVEGQKIELPEDISIEYNSENRLFSNADAYSFDFEVPVRDSKINSEVFGHLWRMDADVDKISFKAKLVTPQMQAEGALAVVGLSETSVSLQFLEGRSLQNFEKDFEEKYVNELELGKFSADLKDCPPMSAWKSYDDGAEAVALPWVNNNSESGNIQNRYIRTPMGPQWHEDTLGLSFMPFLVVVIRRICNALGYSCDIASLENSNFRYLLCCNVLPYALHSENYAEALPHWTINEFFENLEIILRGEFNIDHVAKSVSFRFTADELAKVKPVEIESVVDEFTADVTPYFEDKSDLELLKNISYPDSGSRFWNIYRCDWFVKQRIQNPQSSEAWMWPGEAYVVNSSGHREPAGEWHYESLVEFETMKEFVDAFKSYEYFGYNRNPIVQNNLYYVREFDAYFIFHSTDYVEIEGKGWFHHFELMPVNIFGDYIVDQSDESSVELRVAPVPIDMAEEPMAFLSFNISSESDSGVDEDSFIGGNDSPWDDKGNLSASGIEMNKAIQPIVYQIIDAGESQKSEYYDKIYLGFWTNYLNHSPYVGIRPVVSNVEIYDYFRWKAYPECNLRLNHGFARGCEEYLSIDPNKCYKFSFLADSMPPVRATFYIKGKRYICAKLTATIDANGMNKLIKGEFYRY